MKKKYLIRFNTESQGAHDRWRLIDGAGEMLVSEIRINTPSHTSQDYIEGIGYKFHVCCEGVLEIRDGIATISAG